MPSPPFEMTRKRLTTEITETTEKNSISCLFSVVSVISVVSLFSCREELMSAPARVLDVAQAEVVVFADAAAASLAAADRIAAEIRAAGAARGRAVLGLATGRTPIPLYARLVALHRAGGLSFA